MTMIISAHLGDCILIASDKRSMTCHLETGNMQLATDEEQKIKLWCRGAITGSGETIFLNRIAQHFINFQEDATQLNQMDVIYDEIEKRILEGIPQKILLRNVIIFSIFNGHKTLLYSIPIESFFQPFKENGVYKIHPYMNEITEWSVDVSCFNVPPDMSNLQEFQRNLKPMASFKTQQEFIEYYIENLKHIFATHASIDPSITSSFDLYLQSCRNGESLAMHIANLQLGIPIPENLNYWDR
ncbi:conserved hypothetical protein (plasmid) [Acinetobacter baumannii SDF]|uniref:Uncharacterized protein n=1 Tax=Acinetobacter baumannii (strain SDF) TaxID=509170 RepID=B0VVC2_ACIBS|nr:conserved hypothetical protein [Acinetobacter baumannii SDF]